jgi:hypothetical protein
MKMVTSNPFTDDDAKAYAWELGYIAGFQDPDGTDPLPPFAPDLLDVFNQGIDAGREDRIEPPASNSDAKWLTKSELDDESTVDMIEHVSIEGLAELSELVFKKAAFGLAGLVLTALSVSTDSPMKPLDDDFSELYTGPEDDTNVYFLAVCPRTDHPVPAIGTTQDGYWTGTPRNDFGDALTETLKHGHSEAMVARCSLTDNTCGLVWAAQ